MAVNPRDPDRPRGPRPTPGTAGGTAPPRSRRQPPASRPGGTAVEDTIDAAFTVLVVAAAIGRYAVEVGSRLPRAAVRRLPRTAARMLGALADDLVPRVARAILSRVDVPALVQEYVDLDRLAGLLDVNAVTARVDLDTLLERVDVEAIAAGLDLDALVEKVDIARILDRIDLDDVVARVDLDRAVARVDLDRAVARVDIARVLDRIDLDDVVARVDLDRAVARVDLDRAVDRVDVDRIIDRANVVGLARYVIQEIDLAALVRSSTGSVTAEMVRSVRDQGADADRAVEQVVDRLLRRPGRRTARPPAAAEPDEVPDPGAGR